MPDKQASRHIEVGPNEGLFIRARQYAETDAYKEDRRTRQVVERQVGRMAHVGARMARFFGLAKTRVQVALVAVVVNLARLATLLAARTA